ncbi:hypothetical protein HMF8227_00914 [Saliniradius amylolyticus]|uniref:PilZ domain-containing protein n=1 Tax=Saliniradius amylolyticus TaxID=2183582 RepID=A0A2S2E1D8_9ALTE|nr:PilZ domain-containing protein [Saliniradius amylolyticus]AWL11409.1 hypothetical protein HMF8227_00914 [Saliniradius amylolyticus]
MANTTPYDIEHYLPLIERLKPAVNTPDFERILKDATAEHPDHLRFLIKMELQRQGRPCQKAIDLRTVSNNPCREYQHDGVTHFMDETAIDVFEQQLRRFGDYTLGVYEAVTDPRPESPQLATQPQEDKQSRPAQPQTNPLDGVDLSCQVINTAQFHKRDEERMNFSQPVELFTQANESAHAISVDISNKGLRVKTADPVPLQPDQEVVVYFRELTRQMGSKRPEGITYKVIREEQKSQEERYISLSRVVSDKRQGDDFERFLSSYIRGNKGRYKVNLDNTLQAILIRGYEQYYIPQFTSLPVFIDQLADQPHPRYILTNDSNRELLSYFQNEQRQQCLSHLLNETRLAYWTGQKGSFHTYLYCFSHSARDKTQFYSATREELDEHPELRSTFLGCGAQRASWRVLKVQLTAITPDECYFPSSLPDDVSDKVKEHNAPPTPRLMARLKNLKHLVLLTDITTSVNALSYQKRQVDRDKLNQLARFRHPPQTPEAIQTFRFQYQELRKQSRFLLRTPVNVDTGKKLVTGTTEDVSVAGARIELNEPMSLEPGSRVFLDFPSLQKIAKQYNLRHLEYEVRHISPNRRVVSVQVRSNRNSVSKPFFSTLIKQNRKQMRLLDAQEDSLGIGEALRNIYARHLCNTPVYLQRHGAHWLPDSLLQAEGGTQPLYHLLTRKAPRGRYNFAPFYRQNKEGTPLLEGWIQRIKPQDKPVTYELMAALQPSDREPKTQTDLRLSTEFGDDRARKEFIQRAIGNGGFVALVLMLSKTGKPDAGKLDLELDYVNDYAPHRARELQERLWNVEVMADLVDITDECLRRYGFDEQAVRQNHKALTGPASKPVQATRQSTDEAASQRAT